MITYVYAVRPMEEILSELRIISPGITAFDVDLLQITSDETIKGDVLARVNSYIKSNSYMTLVEQE